MITRLEYLYLLLALAGFMTVLWGVAEFIAAATINGALQ